jgi:Asp-tRNA(Asn)/Glu-tRNA(Gln) amidotransferase B subunit
MVFLKGKKSSVAGGAAIPDFMRVEVEGSESAAKMKKELLETLKPDKETVDEVMGNQALMSGFDDPEVMAAVEDVARDPKNMAKYANNPKVTRFYQQMAGMVGRRLEKKGDNSTSGV